MPRKIIGGAFLSMDGVMQAPGGPEEDPTGRFPYGGWLAHLFDEGLGNQVDTLFQQPFDLLLGRRTYDIFAAFWPFATTDMPIAEAFAKARKYVLSRSDIPLPWEGSQRLDGIEALSALKREDGPNLVIQGSSTLYPQLLDSKLLDRLVTMTAPLCLGQGKRLFGQGTPPGLFRLIEHRVTSGGIAMATYEPAGEIQTGTFAVDQPTPEELERRERIARGDW